MRSLYIVSLALIVLAGCGDYGHHPHYIISQDEVVPESTKGPEQNNL